MYIYKGAGITGYKLKHRLDDIEDFNLIHFEVHLIFLWVEHILPF